MVSCSTTDEDPKILLAYLQNGLYEKGTDIVCAASCKFTGDILTYFYPNVGAKRFRFYETNSVNEDLDDFSNCKLVNLKSEPIFNGHLKKIYSKSYQ
jgi:hypothetical protein